VQSQPDPFTSQLIGKRVHAGMFGGTFTGLARTRELPKDGREPVEYLWAQLETSDGLRYSLGIETVHDLQPE
jgi:hypothetical protein